MALGSDTSSAQQRTSQPGSVVWFISFGDLLTLLLCFFLVLTPWDKLRAAANTKVKQEVGPISQEAGKLGIALASPVSREQASILAEVPIQAEHVSGESLSALVALMDALQQEVAPLRDRAHTLTVTVCDPSVDRLRVVAEVGKLAREFDKEASDIGIEVASDCNRIDILRPTTAKLVGVISMRGV
jgi:hypothetical protein